MLSRSLIMYKHSQGIWWDERSCSSWTQR